MTRQKITRRQFLSFLGVSGAATILGSCARESQATPTGHLEITKTATPLIPSKTATFTPTHDVINYQKLPRWRGFNLLEKYVLTEDSPYQERDLDTIAQWGFDFIRLPTDYRIWTKAPDQYEEQPLRELDQVIEWARARGIHACINLHRAPGYCVNNPKEPIDLWADGSDGEEARLQFEAQWRMLSTRYRGIPAADLSFNLLNEPPDLPAETYVRAITGAVEAIVKEDPQRLIIADGLAWGRQPVPELVPLRISQSTRGYDPMQLTHYRASWVGGSDAWPLPVWPIPISINQYLYGRDKAEFQSPLELTGDVLGEKRLSLRVQKVSNRAHLMIRANGSLLAAKWYTPGPGKGEWEESIYRSQWNDYEAVYDQDITVLLPEGTHTVSMEVEEGDWLTFSAIRIEPFAGLAENALVLIPTDGNWGIRQDSYRLDESGTIASTSGKMQSSGATLWADLVEPWKRFSDTNQIGIHIGEWGAYNQTPHAVVLAWMKDCLDNWKRAGIGWALWNLRGSFGVLDSERSDVSYEDYQGRSLDRKMLELLQRG